LAQNPDVARRFAGAARVVVEPHIALSGVTPLMGPRRPPDGGRRALFVGRVVGWKGPRLAIAALAEDAASVWTLDIIGDGPDTPGCRSLIARLGLDSRVRLRGTLPRSRVLEEFQAADCLLLPSLHDSAGWVVAEALALGVPVVCLDRGGPGYLVGEGQGRKVPATRGVVRNLAAALCEVPGRFTPEHRWNADRLPDLLDAWYGQVVSDNRSRR
jgi:glycosyltransferase involved in cell wall biosynthesis